MSNPVDDEALQLRVGELRAKGATPKAIARTLGLRPAVVAHLVRGVAADQAKSAGGSPAEPELVGCWVSPGWSHCLEIDRRPADWPDIDRPDGSDAPQLASVLVARRDHRRRVSVCGYLVDTGCLGIKNALGPQAVKESRLLETRSLYFRAYDSPPLPAPLSLAQHLVLGAEEYARGLGFEPHPDFAPARAHLGGWHGGSIAITFGRNGKPFYFQGPHDHAPSVIRTLDRTVGKGKYDYVLVVGDPGSL